MEKQKAEARASWAGSGEAQTEAIWFRLRESLGATEFLGYETERAEGEILALVEAGEAVPEAQGRRRGRRRPQPDAVLCRVRRPGSPIPGTIANENGGRVRVDERAEARRRALRPYRQGRGGRRSPSAMPCGSRSTARGAPMIRANHSATHLLHAALRNVLGAHVAQKGSLVAPDRLRFDFSHPKPMDDHEIEAVEDLANAVVLEDAPVVTRLMDREEAMHSGAMALFGEKYGDEVRVVSMGTMPGRSGRARPIRSSCAAAPMSGAPARSA